MMQAHGSVLASLLNVSVLGLPLVLALIAMPRAGLANEAKQGFIKLAQQGAIAVASAPTDEAKRTALVHFKEQIQAAETTARADLERAQASKASADALQVLNEADSEAIKLSLAFDLVFETVLSPSFEKDERRRNLACPTVAHTIRSDELANQPEGTELSDYRRLALDTLSVFCHDLTHADL